MFVTLHLNNYGGNATTYARDGRVGSAGIPMFKWAAASIDDVIVSFYSTVEATTGGVVCADCSDAWAWNGERPMIRHASVELVKLCCQITQDQQDEARWEMSIGA